MICLLTLIRYQLRGCVVDNRGATVRSDGRDSFLRREIESDRRTVVQDRDSGGFEDAHDATARI